MKFGSVCSGIEAASVAWAPLGWEAAWFSEIEEFPGAVLAHRHPQVENLGDMTKIHEKETFGRNAIDLLVGGTPCQSFSVAGLRKGLADPRGNLALTFLGLLDRKRPRWVVWENVPGVISSWTDAETHPATEEVRLGLASSLSDGERLAAEIYGPGRRLERMSRVLRSTLSPEEAEEVVQSADFDTFTSGLRELGYGVAWAILDAQYFGVPQRRRRVFVVGYLGDVRPAAAVLFDAHCLSGNPPPSREAGARAARTPGQGVAGGRGTTPFGPGGEDVSHALTAKKSDRQDPSADTYVAHTLRGEGFDASEDGTGRGIPIVTSQDSTPAQEVDQSYTLKVGTGLDMGQPPIVAIPLQEVGKRTGKSTNDPRAGVGIGNPDDPMFTLQAGAQHGVVASEPVVFTEQTQNQGAAPTLTSSGDRGRNAMNHPCVAFSGIDSGNDASPEVAPTLRKGGDGGQGQAMAVAFEPGIMAREGGHVYEDIAGTLRKDPGDNAQAVCYALMPQNSGKDFKAKESEVAQPVMAAGPQHGNQGGDVICFVQNSRSEVREFGGDGKTAGAIASTMAPQQQNYVAQAGRRSIVRRLTVVECERLQGFPDNYTLIPGWTSAREAADHAETVQYLVRHGFSLEEAELLADTPDGHRYKALGNSMAVPVMRWIGERINAVDEIMQKESR